jgi:carnitine O-acetyltransferase
VYQIELERPFLIRNSKVYKFTTMRFPPLIFWFVPQTHRMRTTIPITRCFLAGTVEIPPVSNATGEEEICNPDLGSIPLSSMASVWEGRSVVKSSGNYVDELFLEQGPLYAHQEELKPLPVPSLKDTVMRFLPTALPLAESEEEAETLKQACENFEKQAMPLQQRLEARLEQTKRIKTSWLQSLWQKGYLETRDPLNFFISYYFLLNDKDTPLPSDACPAITKAAALCRTAVDYAEQITQGQKAPDEMGKKNKKQFSCSTGYKYMFHTCRIPALGEDSYHIYNPYIHRHVVVACRGRFFEIPLEDDEGNLLSRKDLEELLQTCVEQSEVPQDSSLELGWLTTMDRNDWARARATLVERGGPGMAKALERLESALLMVNLDVDTNVYSLQDQAINFYHGRITGGCNRWWDKSIQLAVTRSGAWSYLGEHSMMDGLLPVEFCRHLLTKGTFKLQDAAADDDVSKNVSTQSSLKKNQAKDIFQDVFVGLSVQDQQAIAQHIEKAKSDFSQHANGLEMHVEHFTKYGADFIKHTGCSSDAYAQMAIQIAGYRLFGKSVATYESTQTRAFLHGRTEATRTVSPNSAAFCEAMGKKPQEDTIETRKKKLKMLQEAAFSHSWYSKKASMGLGVDRHFFGLSQMLKEGEEAPELFQHPTFLRSKYWRLSTSTLPTCPGFGPVVDDGLGIGYFVSDNELCFNIAGRTKHGYAERFGFLLSEALDEMHTLR